MLRALIYILTTLYLTHSNAHWFPRNPNIKEDIVKENARGIENKSSHTDINAPFPLDVSPITDVKHDEFSAGVNLGALEGNKGVDLLNGPSETSYSNDSPNSSPDNVSDPSDLMYYLTQYRNRSRRTEDGHLCAAAFVERDQIYTDCTLEVAPDGTTGREWCYLEAQLTGKLERDWGFCQPPSNYEGIRSVTIQRISNKVNQVDELLRSLTNYRKLLKESERRISQCCGLGHKTVGDSLSNMESLVEKTEELLKEAIECRNEIELTRKGIKRIQCEHDKVQNDRKNCTDNDREKYASDGLIGTYYSNNIFDFPALSTRLDKQINLTFVNKMPLIGLTPFKFSIRWNGYIKAPHTGSFTFELETDCYGRVELNGVEIINVGIRMDGDDDVGIRYWIDPTMVVEGKKVSEGQQLVGGKFYKIRVEMSHSQQYKFTNGSESHFKLLWSSHRIHREIIPSMNFYSTLIPQHISLSNIPLDHFELSKGLNGECAYKNNDEIFIANLSRGLMNSLLIRTNETPTVGLFNLSVNDSSLLYVSYSKDGPFPLKPKNDEQWIPMDSSENFQLINGDKVTNMSVKVISLVPRIIYEFQATEVGLPFILFVSSNSNNLNNLCVGREILVSMPGTSEYLSCSESSSHSSEYNCSSSLSGKYLDQKRSVWRTSGGVGEYIQVLFKRPVLVTEFKYRPRDSSYTWPSKITLEFTQGNTETFDILHTNNLEFHKYRLSKPIITTGVKFIIDEIYTSSTETGGSFGVMGIPCTMDEGLRFIEIERCDETLGDLNQIHKFEYGDSFLIECKPECITVSKRIREGPFMDDEMICKIAGSTGYCNSNEDSCVLKLQIDKSLETSKLQFYLSKAPNHTNVRRLFNVKILFRKQADQTPTQGYLIDNGSVKSAVKSGSTDEDTVIYGWLHETAGKPCHTDCNPLYGGGISFPSPLESMKCIQTESCKANYWSIDVPEDGKYQLEVMLGTACKEEDEEFESHLEVNGQVLLDGEVYKSNQFYTIVKVIEVKNRIIKLTSTCVHDNKCTNKNTIIQMVSIKQLN